MTFLANFGIHFLTITFRKQKMFQKRKLILHLVTAGVR